MAVNKSVVCIFDDNEPLEYCGGCRGGWNPFGDPAKTLRENVAELAVQLQAIFGDRVECRYIDITTGTMQDYPELEPTIHQVFLPMTVIDGVPRLHGYLDQGLIIETVKEHLGQAE